MDNAKLKRHPICMSDATNAYFFEHNFMYHSRDLGYYGSKMRISMYKRFQKLDTNTSRCNYVEL